MPRILFVAPSSYPIYGPEANVNAKVLRMLTDGGCVVDLVCRSSRSNIKFYPISNDDYFFENLNSVDVVTVHTEKDVKTIFRHVLTFLKTGYVYKAADWAFAAINVCEKLIKTHQYDYIYTYDYPSEIVGLYITKKYGIKWVATWNDPYIWKKFPIPYGQGPMTNISFLQSKLIADIGKYSYRNIFPSDRLRDYMLTYMTGMNLSTCVVCPHIILEGLVDNKEKMLGSTLKLIHAGALGRERDPKTLLQGLKLFLEKKTNARIELSFLGIFVRKEKDYFPNLIKEYGVEDYVKIIAPVPYAESMEFMKAYDVCVLIEAACEIGIFLPSKVVDYMQNMKSIFALSPAIGVIHDMFIKGNVDYFADVTNPSAIALELERLYDDFERNRLCCSCENLNDYSSKFVFETHCRRVFC